jgi:hypothetical protein
MPSEKVKIESQQRLDRALREQIFGVGKSVGESLHYRSQSLIPREAAGRESEQGG